MGLDEQQVADLEGGKSDSKGETGSLRPYDCRILNEVINLSIQHLYISSTY